MEEANQWQESMRVSVDFRRKTLHLVYKDVGRVMARLTNEIGALAFRLDAASFLKCGVTEVAMEEAVQAASPRGAAVTRLRRGF